MTELETHIMESRLVDTHEHLNKEQTYVESGPDILSDLFDNYVSADLIGAGATPEAVKFLEDSSNPDLEARFAGVAEAWRHCRHTGYGEAVRLIASQVYGMDEITVEGLEANREKAIALRQPGRRREILESQARLDHVQVDDFNWQRNPNETDSDFFLYDLSWLPFCAGDFDPKRVYEVVGVDIKNVSTLDAAMSAFFDRFAPYAIAVKSQHAYQRTLRWEERAASDVERVLQKRLAQQTTTAEEKLVIGDYCWAKGIELAIEHNLPFKIHTGYYAGCGNMPVDRIPAGNLWALLSRYPKARFILMHIAYPYSDELIALAKHYPNVWIDLCWAWSINPFHAGDFLRRFIHAVPANKLFAFGGDSFWPHAALAYSIQARQGLNRALSGEVADGLLTEREAIAFADSIMQGNQSKCFDVVGTRRAIIEAHATP